MVCAFEGIGCCACACPLVVQCTYVIFKIYGTSYFPISARRYGLTDVSDEFLVLLSHATQERLKGVVEKLTQISQHRISVLKVPSFSLSLSLSLSLSPPPSLSLSLSLSLVLNIFNCTCCVFLSIDKLPCVYIHFDSCLTYMLSLPYCIFTPLFSPHRTMTSMLYHPRLAASWEC